MKGEEMEMSKTSRIILLILTTILISNAQAYPITVTDDFGYEVTIEKAPTRIISLSPCNTEILFAVGAGDRVVGGTTYDAYPPEAVNLSKIGGFSTINIEAVVNLTPDLILAAHINGEDTLDTLRNLNFTVVTLNAKTMDDILGNIRLVGNITGNDDTAESLTANMTQQIMDITAVTENVPDYRKPGVLYLVWHDPLYAAGSDTYPTDLIRMAGGTNIVEVEGWPIISLEQVVDKNPRIIICSGMGGSSYTIMDAITSNPVLAQIDAVKNQKIYPIADPHIIELAGPRIVQGLAEMHGYIAPEIQPASNPASNSSTVPTAETPDEAAADNPNNPSPLPGFGLLLAVSMVIAARSTRKRL